MPKRLSFFSSHRGSIHPLLQHLSLLMVIVYMKHIQRETWAFIWTSTYNLGNIVNNICRSSMSALKRISQIRNFLSKESTEKLIHAFVSSRIDSCNALLFGLPEKDTSKLQIVQNSGARIVERARGKDPITPMLTRLHWLPVDNRIVNKIVLLCHKVIIYLPT